MIGTRMHRVLAIPELLDMIFSFLDKNSNTCNACVSKQWSEIALDSLWHDINDFHRLFSLLAPITRRGDSNDFEFVRLPNPTDWKRFEKYGRRVRRLLFQRGPVDDFLPQSVFDDVARTRTILNILPHVHTLQWNQPLPLSVMFMHESIKQFIIQIPDDFFVTDLSLRPLFMDVTARMPKLTLLDIRTNISVKQFEDDIMDVFRGLPKLKKVVFPRYYVTSKIAQVLSLLAELEAIEFQYHAEQGCGDRDDTYVFQPHLADGAFPSLWDLSLTIRFEDASRFINIPYSPSNLTAIHIDSPVFETPDNIYGVLAMVADNLQLLSSLSLLSRIDVSVIPDQVINDADTQRRITFETLKPLLRLSNLTHFEILHSYPLDIQQSEIEELARAWPSLKSLILNIEPAAFRTSTLTLQALLPFAKHCPKLHHLGLFLHASAADIPTSYQSPTPSYIKAFEQLSMLSLGLSIIAEPGPVALFLSQICPLGCKLESGVTWTWEEDFPFSEEFDTEVALRCRQWDKVNELLPLLTKLRMEERERTKVLLKEVEDLRTRTRILMELEAARRSLTGGGDACILL